MVKKIISFRLPSELREFVDQEAEARNCSRTKIIVEAVSKYIEVRKREGVNSE
jgi:predicted transcriptional regulator